MDFIQKMIPKIDFKNHEVLTRVFMPPKEKKKNFEKRTREFVKRFKRIEKKALISIEKFSGFKWSKKRIPVYLMPPGKWFVSVTKPNLENGLPGTLPKIRKDMIRNTHIMIHELVHVNQYQSDFFEKKNKFIFKKDGDQNRIKIEICTEIVCLYVVRELFGKNSSYEKDFWEFLNNVQKSTPGKEKEVPKYLKKWDLNKKPLREYILK